MKKITGWRRTAMLAAVSGSLLTTVPFAAYATDPATMSPTATASDQTATGTATLTQAQALAAIQKVDPIPSGYSLNHASYQEANPYSFWPHGIWNISLENTKGSDSSNSPMPNLMFTVDGITGQILSVHAQVPNTSDLEQSISETDSEKIANDWLKKLAPDQAGQVQLMKDNSSMPQDNLLITRTYNFVRLVNGIPYPQNNVTIGLDMQGHLVNYQFRWSDGLTFPDAKPSVTSDQALSEFQDHLQMTLEYNMINQMQMQGKASLNYLPFGPDGLGSFPIIDAMSGQIVNRTGQAVTNLPQPDFTPITKDTGALPAQELTKEQAIALVQKFPIDLDGYTLNSANYQTSTRNQDPGWHFSYGNANAGGPLEITVDAKTGDLIDFEHMRFGGPNPNDTTPPAKISYEQAKQAAVQWILQTMPAKASTLALDPATVNNFKSQGTYNVRFIRLHDGIPTSSTIQVGVNNQTGKVDSMFGPNFASADYEDKSQAISAAEAKQAYLNNADFKPVLQYMPVYSGDHPPYGQPDKVMLVYAPVSSLGSYMQLNALSGQWVSPYSGTGNDAKNITDIKGHWAEKYMTNLYLQGVFTPEDNKLYPDKTVTRSDAVRALVILGHRFYQSNENTPVFQDVPATDPNYFYIQNAVHAHWIDASSNQFRPNDTLTREELAQWVAYVLGDKDLTLVPGALTNHFHDLQGLDPASVNAIAIAQDLGYMLGNDGEFHPHDPVTRAQLAVVLTRLTDHLTPHMY